ncbi:MAG: hypothetical protein H7235_12215 [Bdellovibrionaceae bacterium]|nr:hypothetical protein [Pseudobdellovibrionaceae bacterium]
MHDGTLYPQKAMAGTFNVSVQLDEENYQKIAMSEPGEKIIVDALATEGFTGNPAQVFIKPDYEELSVGVFTLDDIEITRVHGQQSSTNLAPGGNLYPQNTKITIKGVRN